jgi:nickel-dependent lactate racemase
MASTPLSPLDGKIVTLEFGERVLSLRVPESCVELSMNNLPPLLNPQAAINEALARPLACPRLPEIIRAKAAPPAQLKVAIAVSDITRPVPYRGPGGILLPLLAELEGAGVRRENILIIVANGMHRPSTLAEREFMFGPEITASVRIVDHDCEDEAALTWVGKSGYGRDVFVNTLFYEADVRLTTGLVESHFMAGVSGGRKSVCPGLVDKRTIEKFHSPDFLESPQADNLILQGNPCHDEAEAVAALVGVDFIVNVCLDRDLRLQAVFAGHLVEAHRAAYEFVRKIVAINVEEPFDVVLTHGGYVGRNHYQLAKAACNALPVLKPGGVLILAAHNHDPEPIGGPEYISLLHLLKMQGPEGYLRIISAPEWKFTKDQWEPEMWGKVLRKVGEEGLIYCAPHLSREQYYYLPGRSGYDFLPAGWKGESLAATAELMLQNALRQVLTSRPAATMAFVQEGPYAVPRLAT